MANDKLSAIDGLVRTVTLEFAVRGGRVFAYNAASEKLNRQTIELKCEACGSWMFGDDDVVIGSDKHPVPKLYEEEGDDRDENEPIKEEEGWRLTTIPTMISLYEVDDEWLKESADRNEGNPILGQFEYHEPIQTSDGVVNEKWPKVLAWVAVGSDTFRLVRERLLQFQKYDFTVGLEVLFPEGAIDSNWTGRKVAWNGEGQLRISSATIIWKREDWSSKHRRKERPGSEPKVELPNDTDRKLTEILNATRRIEMAAARLAAPMWLAAGALIALLVFKS